MKTTRKTVNSAAREPGDTPGFAGVSVIGPMSPRGYHGRIPAAGSLTSYPLPMTRGAVRSTTPALALYTAPPYRTRLANTLWKPDPRSRSPHVQRRASIEGGFRRRHAHGFPGRGLREHSGRAASQPHQVRG